MSDNSRDVLNNIILAIAVVKVIDIIFTTLFAVIIR